jgi:hypothetical protein
MRHPVKSLLAVCGAIAWIGACKTPPPSDETQTAPREPITSLECSLEQRAALEEAFDGICKAVARRDGPCQMVLREYDALQSFQRQCSRGLTVRCREALCGQYVPRRIAFYTDDGTIEIGLGGLAGGRGCGGYDNPMNGPAHTLTHEMAHAAHLVSDGLAEKVAYACRSITR